MAQHQHTSLPAILDPTPEMLDAFQSGFIDQLHRRYQLRHSPKIVGTESAEQGGLRAMLSAMPAGQQRLIAAAPSLLALSKFLLERLDDFERDPLTEDDIEYIGRQFAGHVGPAIESLRAAIASAEAQP